MPRKHSNTRPRKTPRTNTPTPTRNPSCEQLARSLVNRGLCTPQILEHPNTEKNTDDQK